MEVTLYDFGRGTATEFGYAVKYVLERYGFEGVKCLILHHLLDYIGYLVKHMYGRDLIIRKTHNKFMEYLKTIEYDKELPHQQIREYIENTLKTLKQHLDALIKELYRPLPLEKIVYDRIYPLICQLCSLELIARGIRGKGLKARQQEYQELISGVAKRLNKELASYLKELDPKKLVKELDTVEEKNYSLKGIKEKTRLLNKLLTKITDVIKAEADKILSGKQE